MEEYATTIDRHAIIVDDEAIFLSLAAAPFQAGFCGYCTWHLHTFSDPVEAIAFVRRRDVLPDVLLTDLHMPSIDGLELIRRIRVQLLDQPELLPAILMTIDPMIDMALPELTAHLQKPFTADDVKRAFCEVSGVCVTGACARSDGTAKPKPPESASRPRTPEDPPGTPLV